MNKEQIKAALLKLTVSERNELINEIGSGTVNASSFKESRREALQNRQGSCPHCQSGKYRKHGIDKGSQRYQCTSCNRTFTEFTGTWMAGLHKKHLVEAYIGLMEKEYTLDKIKEELKINKKTAFDWRHKILSSLEKYANKAFVGITESDETFFQYSEKGSRSLSRKPKKRGKGTKTEKKKRKRDQVAVIVTTDRSGSKDITVTRRGYLRKSDVEKAIGDRVSDKTVLCSDGNVVYKGFAIDKGLEHHVLRGDMRQYVRGSYHIQNVNGIDSRLKRWIHGRFGGVSTKYLQKYMNWFKLKESLSKSSNYSQELGAATMVDTTAIDCFNNIENKFKQLTD